MKAWRAPTWLLGFVVALFGWGVSFGLPSYGIDVSWWSGLYMAAHDNLQFGPEVVFTYGPLGFMKLPTLWYEGLASIAFLYGVAMAFAFSCALIWTLRPRIGTLLACLITFLIQALVPIDPAIGVAVLWGFALFSDRAPRQTLTLLITAGAFFAAAESLMKLSSGPVILLVLLIALIGARVKGRQIATFAGVYVVSLLALWLITGQSLGNIPDFVTNSIQIVLGYNEAMASYYQSNWLVFLMVLGVVLALAWNWIAGEYSDRRSRVASTAIVLVVGLAMYKQGVVRIDASHVSICFAGIAVLWAAVPARSRWNYLLLTGMAALMVASIHVAPAAQGMSNLDAFGNLKQAKTEIRTLLSPERKTNIVNERRAALQGFFNLDPAILRQLEDRTVSVDPWEVSVAWAYDLDWSPLPVFQNYSAYTSELDELNADEVESSAGPERILKGLPMLDGFGIDQRNVNWDPPAQAIATLCNFAVGATSFTWEALVRVPDRCGPETLIDEVESNSGEVVEVPVPAPDEVVFARIEGTEPSGLEKLRSLLYKPRLRTATLSGGVAYRLLTATAEDGLLLRGGARVKDSEGLFSQVPDTETIQVDGAGDDLKFDFYRMKVEPGQRDRPGERRPVRRGQAKG